LGIGVAGAGIVAGVGLVVVEVVVVGMDVDAVIEFDAGVGCDRGVEVSGGAVAGVLKRARRLLLISSAVRSCCGTSTFIGWGSDISSVS
jgi:hypothetical protein